MTRLQISQELLKIHDEENRLANRNAEANPRWYVRYYFYSSKRMARLHRMYYALACGNVVISD